MIGAHCSGGQVRQLNRIGAAQSAVGKSLQFTTCFPQFNVILHNSQVCVIIRAQRAFPTLVNLLVVIIIINN